MRSMRSHSAAALAALSLLAASCASVDDSSAEQGSVEALTLDRDVAVIGDTTTFLKASEAQSSALPDGAKCSLAPRTKLPLARPARLTASGHLELHVAPRARIDGCDLATTDAPLYVFAPHVRSTESRGETRDGAAARFREGMLSTSDGLDIRYIACAKLGLADAGPVVVLLHPAGADAESTWYTSGVFGTLEGRGFCPVALDLRGHGESSKPHTAAAYDVERLQRDVVESLDALGVSRAHFHGYSLGGSLLIRLLPRLAARGVVLSAAFGGAGLPDGRRDDVAGRDRSRADRADVEARSGPALRTDKDALAALFERAPWTQPLDPLPFERLQFPLMGLFGDFDNPMQNTRTFARRAPARYVGTAVFKDRLHVGTIAPKTMPASYAEVLAAFFSGAPAPARPDYTFVLRAAVAGS